MHIKPTAILLIVLLVANFVMLSGGAHAASTTNWTQKKIVLVWDGKYDNSTLSSTYKNQLKYVYYWLQEKGIPFEKIYAKDIKWSMVNDTTNYTYFIIPILRDSCEHPLVDNLTASHLLITKDRYAIINYAGYGVSESTIPDDIPEGATINYVPSMNTKFGRMEFSEGLYVRSAPLQNPNNTTVYATDDNGNAEIYEYRGNVFSLLGYSELHADIALNLLFTLKLHFAEYAIPVVLGIDDARDNHTYTMIDGTNQTLTYNNLANLSKVLRKWGFKADLILQTGWIQKDGAIVKAVNDNPDVLFVSIHQNELESYGDGKSYATIEKQYDDAYANFTSLNFNSNVTKDLTSWILPAGRYDDNTSHFASDRGIRYFVIANWGVSWKGDWWNSTAVKPANKNGNTLPWQNTSYPVYVVPRSYADVFAYSGGVSNETQVEEWWQKYYGTTHNLSYSIKNFLGDADDLELMRGDLYFHIPSFTNDEISQQYIDAVGNYYHAAGKAWIGVTMTEHNDFTFGRQTSTITFSYAPQKVRVQISNNGPYTFPYYVAIPRILMGNLSPNQHYAVNVSSASIVNIDNNYVYVKVTVPSSSSVDFYITVESDIPELPITFIPTELTILLSLYIWRSVVTPTKNKQ